MKFNIIFIFTFCFSFCYTQETIYLSEHYDFKIGDTAYLFGDNVKFRTQPDLDSEIIELLKIGESIEIIEKTEVVLPFDGIDSHWYKIKNNDITGYILGALISLDTKRYKDLTYLTNLKKEEGSIFLKTRVLTPEKEYEECVSKLSTGMFSVNAYNNKGLDNVESIFHIDYLSESCGTDGGGIYLFYNGEKLIKAFEYIHIADADLYWHIEDYKFPDSDKKLNGKIEYNREIGENKDYDSSWIERTITRRLLTWENDQLTPIVEDGK